MPVVEKRPSFHQRCDDINAVGNCLKLTLLGNSFIYMQCRRKEKTCGPQKNKSWSQHPVMQNQTHAEAINLIHEFKV